MLSKSVMCVLAPPMNSLSTMAWPAQIRDVARGRDQSRENRGQSALLSDNSNA